MIRTPTLEVWLILLATVLAGAAIIYHLSQPSKLDGYGMRIRPTTQAQSYGGG